MRWLLVAVGFSFMGCLGVLNAPQSEKPQNQLALAAIAASNSPLPGGTVVATGRVGPEGGSLRSEDGRVHVNIPAGAMDSSVDFAVARYTPTTNALPQGYFPTSPVYQIVPSFSFKKDVSVSIVIDGEQIQNLNLSRGKTAGFMMSSSATEANSIRLPGWSGVVDSRLQGDRLFINTRTFSIFTAGSPPPGNLPPNILGSVFYLKSGTKHVPYRVRARVRDPDGDAIIVYLLVSRPGQAANAMRMNLTAPEFYELNIPLEVLTDAGVILQVLAVDAGGRFAINPHAPFRYPDDTGNSTYTSEYKVDDQGDGIHDVWEVDNGFDPQVPGDTAGVIDTDGDGIPNTADFTPNGEALPALTAVSLVPGIAQMTAGELVAFGVEAANMGAPRYVATTISASGTGLSGGDVGTLNGSTFLAVWPGTSTLSSTVGGFTANATVIVADTLAPSSITNLTATAQSHRKVRLQWSAPGNDGAVGQAATYEIRYSASAITDDATCTSGIAVNHSVTPAAVGSPEVLDLDIFAPGTQYHFCIRAYDANGNRGTWAGSVQALTMVAPDVVRPAPLSVVASVLNPTTARLDWTAVGDDGNTGAAAVYEVRRSVQPINDNNQCDSSVLVATINAGAAAPAGTAMFFPILGLAEDTRYYFCVRAADAANNKSDWSGLVDVTTPDDNDPPIIQAGPSQTVEVNATVDLSGATASDPDAGACQANPANYVATWQFLARPGGSTATITNPNSFSGASFLADRGGTFVLQLTFQDEAGVCQGGAKTVVDTMSVTVDDQIPAVTVTGNQFSILRAATVPATNVSWQTDRAGTYSVRIGGTSCATATLSNGANAGGSVAAGGAVVSQVLAADLSSGTNLVRICVQKPSGIFGSATILIERDEVGPTVSASPGTGQFGAAPSISLSCMDSVSGCGKIIYTTDGSVPTFDAAGNITNGTEFTGPFSPADETITTVRFRARDQIGNVSDPLTEAYAVDSTLPAIVAIPALSYTDLTGRASYAIVWRTTNAGGRPYSFRVGGTDCATATPVASGQLITGNAPTVNQSSAVDRTALTIGVPNTIRICIQNLAGVWGEYPYTLIPCINGEHEEAGACRPSLETRILYIGGVAVGTERRQFAGSAWLPWTLSSCYAGYHAWGGTCAANFERWTVAGAGTGSRWWDPHSVWDPFAGRWTTYYWRSAYDLNLTACTSPLSKCVLNSWIYPIDFQLSASGFDHSPKGLSPGAAPIPIPVEYYGWAEVTGVPRTSLSASGRITGGPTFWFHPDGFASRVYMNHMSTAPYSWRWQQLYTVTPLGGPYDWAGGELNVGGFGN